MTLTRNLLAETEGFEPSVPVRGLHLSRVAAWARSISVPIGLTPLLMPENREISRISSASVSNSSHTSDTVIARQNRSTRETPDTFRTLESGQGRAINDASRPSRWCTSVLLPQLVLAHLATGGAWQIIHEDHVARDLVLRQPALQNKSKSSRVCCAPILRAPAEGALSGERQTATGPTR